MSNIKNSYIHTSTTFNKASSGIACIVAISAIAIALIGLVAPTGDSFKIIVQMGSIDHGILLGISIVVLILDLLWIKALYKKKNFSQSASSLIQPESIPAPATTTSAQVPKIAFAKLKPDTLIDALNVLFLSYLDPNTLDKCSYISGWENFANTPSLWNAFDLRTLSPKLRIFDAGDWETYVDLPSHGLDMSNAPPLNKRALIPELSRLISDLTIEKDSGLTFLTIPKGLTLNKLIRLAGIPKQGHITSFSSVWHTIIVELGDIPVDHTYRIAISNNILTGSRNKSATSQVKLVKEFRCQMPSILEACTLIVITHMYSGERLYNDSPLTLTRCSDKIAGYHSVVGGLGSDGLTVSNCFFEYDDIYGVAVAWRVSR